MNNIETTNKQKKIQLGVKFIIGFYILNIIFWVFGQGLSVIAYDTVAQWGLVEARDTVDPFCIVINRAIGHPGMIGSVFTEAIVTGIGAALLSFGVSILIRSIRERKVAT